MDRRRQRRARAGESLAARVSRLAAAGDLVVSRLSRYCLTAPARDALVLGYGGLPVPRIAAGVQQLARCIESGAPRVSGD